MGTEVIQIQVPSDLARRLRLHQDDLPRILEQGLRSIEKVEAATASRKDVIAALRSTGILVELDPAIAARYRAASKRRSTPVQVPGKPLSEIIIEERGRG